MLHNYPLTSELQQIEITDGWKFKHRNEIRGWCDQTPLGVDSDSKLFAFDKKNYPRMIEPKGVYGAIREILYSRICEKLGILCESAQFIILSKEHMGMAKGESRQAGIFLLPKSEPLQYWISQHYKGPETEFITIPVEYPDSSTSGMKTGCPKGNKGYQIWDEPSKENLSCGI